jgi:hypothetical protein
MLVRFETKAYPSITMFGDVAVKLLKLMGMSGDVPGAIKGKHVGDALRRLRSGIAGAESEADRGTDRGTDRGDENATSDDTSEAERARVALKVRAFPLMELLSIAADQGNDVLWTERKP